MKVLFLCVANSARSQMAEGLAQKMLGPQHEILSAGSSPGGTIHPLAQEMMKEEGISIMHQRSKHWEVLPADFMLNLDYVITLCEGEVCPVLSSKAQRLHWPLPDPVTLEKDPLEMKEVFHKVKETLKEKLLSLQSQPGFL